MVKRLSAVAILLLASLLINIFIYEQTFNMAAQQLSSLNRDGECIGFDTPQKASVKISAGEPLSTNSKTTVALQECGTMPVQPTFHITAFMGNWQFYADWLACSLPLLGIAYVAGKRYAHHRH